MKTIIFSITTIIILLLPLTTSLQQQEQQQQVDKTQLINAVFEDADENCNLPIGEYTDDTVQTSLDICKKGMSWLKVECNLHYDNVPLCRENMPNIKRFLDRNYFDDRDINYFADQYQNRLSLQYDEANKVVIQEEKEKSLGKGYEMLERQAKDFLQK